MIYDVRMGPQGLYHEGAYYITYQASPKAGAYCACAMERDASGVWSEPTVIGEASHYDHHYAPVLWLDSDDYIHVLYHCHSSLHGSIHKISTRPLDISSWEAAQEIAPSISYPRLLRCPSGNLILYYRSLGHMGYWTLKTSNDGGHSWESWPNPIVDFDQSPIEPGDEWAGTYHSVALSRDGRSIHVAFTYWDERKKPHPAYGIEVGTRNRYNLYYARVDIDFKELCNIYDEPVAQPLVRRNADTCMVWDTGSSLTNMPTLYVDENEQPGLLAVSSGEKLDDCRYWFIVHRDGAWRRSPITQTNDTWSGSWIEDDGDGGLTAFLVTPPERYGNLPYGGGVLQEWHSMDRGKTWAFRRQIAPGSGLLSNNPKPIEDAHGAALKRTLLFFSWPGPDGISPSVARGAGAYLWRDGVWL